MTVAGAHRISIDTFGLDFGSFAPFERIVQSKDQWADRLKEGQQQMQQNSADRQARPLSTIENAVVILKLSLLLQTHDSKNYADGSLPGGEDGSDNQHLG